MQKSLLHVGAQKAREKVATTFDLLKYNLVRLWLADASGELSG